MLRVRTPIAAALALLMVFSATTAGTAVADDEKEPVAAPPTLSATLDGKPIPLADVGRFYCDDFSYPVIRCSQSANVVEQRASAMQQATAVTFVTVYEYASFGGAYMHVSQDYSALATIGWNDRISAFKGRNSETGAFHTDWFYGGTLRGFCCNTQQATLGAYDNTFSSIRRT